MVIKIPQYHDFPRTLKKKIFSKTGCSLPEWEISVQKRDDLAWSVVLSYLMSTNYTKQGDFARRLKTLTGSDANAKLVNKSIRHFNPFRNRWSCFYDAILKTVVNNFIKHLNWNQLSDISDKLLLASEILQCPILLIREDSKSINYQKFTKTMERNQNLIALIASSFENFDNPKLSTTIYNFLIDDSVGHQMKTAALHYYLAETVVPKKVIKKLTPIVSEKDTFIKAVLNSKYKNAILDVYKSPYVVSKLSEAGFEMDPRTKDCDGFSGLYYAVIVKDAEILYKLYYFAVNNCCQAEASFRNPDPNIVSNLQNIKELLLDNISKLKEEYEEYSYIKMKFEELLRLNEFLIEINGKILEIKNRLNYYESTSDTIFEAGKRRDVIVFLLDTYKKFFHYHDSSSEFALDNYINHKDYYLSVDMLTAMIFFDNITFLKERLKLEEDKKFSDIESSIYFLIVYNSIFQDPDALKGITFYTPRQIHIFPLMYRFDNFSEMNNFRDILHNININEDAVVNHIPEREIHLIFHSHPVIKNVLGMDRLEKYILICKTIRVMDIKSVLVIQRVLQVIGECIAPEKVDDFTFKRFLSLCLPKEIAQILRRLRNVLTHLKGHAFPSKIHCEKNMSLFRSILSEIHEIFNYFRRVGRIIDFSYNVHLLNQFEMELQRVKNSAHLFTDSFLRATFLTKKIVFSKNYRVHCLKEVRLSCHNFLKMALINLENDINKEYESSDNKADKAKHRIIYLLWPLKWFLELLQQCDMSSAATALNSFKELESSHIETLDTLKEKTDALIKECYGILPGFNVVAKRNMPNALKSTKYIEYFMNILKGFVYLSNEEKDSIRKEIPDVIKRQVSLKNRLIQSTESGFNMDVNTISELTYLSKNKMRKLRMLYETKDSGALTILETPDPVSELEEIFAKDYADKKKYDKLCETMQFSEETRNKLSSLVAGQKKKKLPANNLVNLLNRIQLLKAIIIDEDEDIQKLWLKIEEKSSQLIDEKIVQRYSYDLQFQVAVEMLLFDCMILFEGVKLPAKLWTKSSKLYQGINMRNIISHGNPLVEGLCWQLDQEELPSEIVKKVVRLMKGEDAVKAILELHESADNDLTKLLEIINSDMDDEYSEIRGRIKSCNEWENYALLLPDTHGVQNT